jgi:hypothetical protein
MQLLNCKKIIYAPDHMNSNDQTFGRRHQWMFFQQDRLICIRSHTFCGNIFTYIPLLMVVLLFIMIYKRSNTMIMM